MFRKCCNIVINFSSLFFFTILLPSRVTSAAFSAIFFTSSCKAVNIVYADALISYDVFTLVARSRGFKSSPTQHPRPDTFVGYLSGQNSCLPISAEERPFQRSACLQFRGRDEKDGNDKHAAEVNEPGRNRPLPSSLCSRAGLVCCATYYRRSHVGAQRPIIVFPPD